jgi:hypothetical protein
MKVAHLSTVNIYLVQTQLHALFFVSLMPICLTEQLNVRRSELLQEQSRLEMRTALNKKNETILEMKPIFLKYITA